MKRRTDMLSNPEDDRAVLTVRDSDTISRAAGLMRRGQVGSLVAVDLDDRVVGIVTERDIIFDCIAQGKDPCDVRVADIMTGNVVSVRPGISFNDADAVMSEHGIRHLPVVEDGKAVEMISTRDVMAARLGTVQAMKDAAEQIALLSKNVRKLDMQEILDRLESELPSVFGARRWALYLASEDRGSERQSLIQRTNCPCSPAALVQRAGGPALAGDKSPGPMELPDDCRRLGASGCCAAALLVLAERRNNSGSDSQGESSYLCMCGLPKSSEASSEVFKYKLGLVADILTVNFANARLYRAAYRDPLTGLRTRRAMEEALGDEYSRGLRYGRAFCVAMLDVDNFKNVNDTYGHAVGDDVLRRLGSGLLGCMRAHDLTARYGGDEVAILMPETNIDEALVVMERLYDRLKRELRIPAGPAVTVSCGLAQWSGQAEQTAAAVACRADEALYEAKRAGRNCIMVDNGDSCARHEFCRLAVGETA